MGFIMPAPRGLVQRFDEHLHRTRLLAAKSRVLVAVSGGADSVALLRLLVAVNGGKHWGFSIVIGHVNHRTRGAASDGDEKFVRAVAKELGVKFLCRRLTRGKKSEAALRAGRLSALAAMARAARYDCVALAHQCDDQAETVLMRILRGTGLNGLGGIDAEREIGVKLVRPLLVFSGEELRAYLRKIGQAWREDASNQSNDYLRNRIRHEALPMLEGMQKGAARSLVRLAERASEVQALLEGLARVVEREAELEVRKGGAQLRRNVIRAFPRVILAELFRGVLERIGAPLAEVTAERLDAVIRVAIGKAGGKTVELPGGVTMKTQGQRIFLTRSTRRTRREAE
jgi:tRNA(Ile)-lysidine synthase